MALKPQRWLVALAVAVGSLAALAPAKPAQSAPASFIFTGSGWGHRVGLPQYGALEQAKDGKGWRSILGYYYKGTSIGSNDVPGRVRVLLAGEMEQIRVSAASRFSFTSNGNEVAASPGGDGAWSVRVRPSGQFTIYRPNGLPATTPVSASSPLKINYEPWSTVLSVEGGRRYRWGKIELTAVGDSLRVILDIQLERYVRGIAEVPASWPMDALRAQAVAARTYAADKARRLGNHRSGCDCTLYGDTRDQVYRGYEKEDPAISANARWVEAVDSTAAQVVTYSSHPIQAYFHSSSGGKTDSSGEVWSESLPYLVPVDDPWSLRPSNPYAHWVAKIAQETIADKLGLQRIDSIAVTARTAGDGVKTVTVRGSATKTISGSSLRSKLGLRSTKFTIGASQEAFWSPWARIEAGDQASGSPSLAASGSGVLHALVTSPGGVPYWSRRDPATGRWSGWSRAGSSSITGTDASITVAPSGAAQAIIRAGSGQIFTARLVSGSSWSPWVRIGSESSRGMEPAISSGPDGVIWAVMRGQNTPSVWAARRDVNNGWSGWVKVADDGYEPTVAGTSGGAVVVARGADRAVKAATYSGGWSGWSRVASGSGNAPALLANGSSLVLVVRGRSSDRLYSSTRSGGAWTSWSQVSGSLVASGAVPTLAFDSTGHTHVFVRGPGDIILTAVRGSGSWAGFFQVGDDGDHAASGTSIAAAAASRRVYVLVRGPSGGLFTSYSG